MNFFIMELFSKCNQTRRKLQKKFTEEIHDGKFFSSVDTAELICCKSQQFIHFFDKYRSRLTINKR